MMNVEKIYIDLKEATQETKFGKDVRVLESEAFKDPITIQIGYSDNDKAYIDKAREKVEQQVGVAEKVLQKIENKLNDHIELLNSYKEAIKQKDEKIEDLEKKLEKSEKEKIKILKEVEGIRATMMSHNEQLDQHKDDIDEIRQNLTKQPKVYNGQTFISGNGRSALTALKVKDGDYAVIRRTKIVEKNEYTENDEYESGAMNIHVQDGLYVPEYDLRGTTQLDTPTATIDRAFTLIPS